MPVFEEKTTGSGIILPNQTKNAEEVAAFDKEIADYFGDVK